MSSCKQLLHPRIVVFSFFFRSSTACYLHAGGSLVGLISGAVKGQTTETGLFRGAGIGAISGAIVSVDVLESCFQGEILSKVRSKNFLACSDRSFPPFPFFLYRQLDYLLEINENTIIRDFLIEYIMVFPRVQHP